MPTTSNDIPFLRLPADCNLRFMLMFYALPKALVQQRPSFLDMPRRFREVWTSEKWLGVVESDAFLEVIMDCYAWTAWQFFKVPSPKGGYMKIPGTWNQYSGDFPLWRYAYAVPPLILQKMEVRPGSCIQMLLNLGRDYEAPWVADAVFYGLMDKITEEIVAEQNWQPVFDEVWHNRLPEDYSGASVKQRDFMRSWYHTREPEKQISVEQVLAEGAVIDHRQAYDFVDESADVEAQAAGRDYLERFMGVLTDRDKRILELRMQNMPMAEIAKEVGYANAGAVSKRIRQMTQRYEAYEKKNEEK